ncbi:unnamed protein product [Durusdinium trenchii]|uniref:Cyclic nucleotide-binding domain-containing protein n=1 Tax=Durusdinium trenchii TaxID=1381693 RepID=A0ABP0LMJ2_9DINO
MSPPLVGSKSSRAASAETVDSAIPSVTRQEAVRAPSRKSTQSMNSKASKEPSGLGRLFGLYKFQQRVSLARSVFASFTRDSRSNQWSPGELERSLYEGQHHDDEISDILNIKELFHGDDDDVDEDLLWRFHLSRAARMVELVRLLSVVGTCIVAPLSFILSGDLNNPELVPGGSGLLAFDCIMDVVYGICLALRFRISFLHPITKKEVLDPQKIRSYFTGSVIWWIQVASAFSYLWLGLGATLLLNNLKIIRVGPLLRAPDALWRLEDNIVVRLGRPVVLLVLGAHWTACLLFTVGGFRQELINHEEEFATTFNMGYGISGQVSGGVSLYFMAFVEALYMLTGSLDNPLGDGGPRHKDFGSLLMVSIFGPLGCVVVALFISAIMREQQRAFALDSKHEENKAFMERALQILEIPPELQRRVLSMHLFQKFEHDVEAFNSLFEKKNLSKALENTLLVYLYRQTLVTSPHFRNKDPNYIIAVVNVLEDQVFLPGDYVVRKGEVATSMYFVSRGWLTILVADHEDEHNVDKAKPIPQRLGVGDQFGEIALVRDTVRTAWVRADTYVIVSALPSSAIRHVWHFYPKEREELLQTVERHAERDRKRRVRQRWEKGLGGATVTPWKVRGGPSEVPKVPKTSEGESGRCEQSDSGESPRSAPINNEPSDREERNDLSQLVVRRLQAIESRMDELLRRQRTLERRLESKPSGGPMEEKQKHPAHPAEEKWSQKLPQAPTERPRSGRLKKAKPAKPCVDLTGFTGEVGYREEGHCDPSLEKLANEAQEMDEKGTDEDMSRPAVEADAESVILQLNFPEDHPGHPGAEPHGAFSGSER